MTKKRKNPWADVQITSDPREVEGKPLLYSTDQAKGALANGTRIEKRNSERGDNHPDGAKGTVLGSISHPDVGIAYFIEWDDRPGLPIATVEKKVRPERTN